MDFPPAVLSVDHEKRAHICAWCKGKEAAEVWCQEQNLAVTHGICPRCRDELMQRTDPPAA